MDRRYELLGETIEILLKYQGRTAKSCGRDLSPIFGVSSPFAESWINFARKGYIYGTPGTPQNPKKQRERLCHFLRYLRISPEAEIIQGIKERDHNFVYPPEIQEINSSPTHYTLEVLLNHVQSKDYPAIHDYLRTLIKEA